MSGPGFTEPTKQLNSLCDVCGGGCFLIRRDGVGVYAMCTQCASKYDFDDILTGLNLR
jgi:hypothetical protein